MENDVFVNYDALCYATFVNIKTMTSRADKIAFVAFDAKDKEHLFVLSVTMACWNILGEKPVTIDENLYYRRKLNKKYKDIGTIGKTEEDETITVNIVELLAFMRDAANRMCGDGFNFGEIYDAYYADKE